MTRNNRNTNLKIQLKLNKTNLLNYKFFGASKKYFD